MNASAASLRKKAQADLATALRELGVVEAANYDAVCFHAQQAAEKAIKATLIEVGAHAPRSHDLWHLWRLLSSAGAVSEAAVSANDLVFLTRAAVEMRYGDDNAAKSDADRSVAIAQQILASLAALAPPNHPA